MNVETIHRLRPHLESLDPSWSHETLTTILAAPQDRAGGRSRRRRIALVSAALVGIALGAGTAAAAAGVITPADWLHSFSQDSARDVGTIGAPSLVAEFTTTTGRDLAFWTATTSTGESCFVASLDGVGNAPTADAIAHGCDPAPSARPGGFFKDADGPMVYGVAPYDAATHVRVTGDGVDSTLPVRPDSHGYGAALPGAGSAHRVEVTFLDADDHELGRTTLVAEE